MRRGLLIVILFLPGVLFFVFRRGGGELCGCAIELPSLLKKSPIGLPAAACPPDKKRSHRQNQSDSLKQAIHKCCHFALRSAVFNISGAFLVRDAALRVRDGQRRPCPLKIARVDRSRVFSYHPSCLVFLD